jgi:hypothetical protein
MGEALPVASPAALRPGALTDATANPADGGVNVHIVGGSVTSSDSAVEASVATIATQATAGAASEATTATETTQIAGELPSSLGSKAPSASTSVTGSLASASLVSVADATAFTSQTQLSSMASGPGGIRVQNTSATGQPNLRVGDSNTGTARGVQLAPGVWEVFPVANANLLYVASESGSPTYSVNQA